jgi:cytosine/adenosine deaminase-related metal-dependent hydrolase
VDYNRKQSIHFFENEKALYDIINAGCKNIIIYYEIKGLVGKWV